MPTTSLDEILLTSLENCILWMDLSGKISGGTQKAAELFGYKQHAKLNNTQIEKLFKKIGWTNTLIKRVLEANQKVIKTAKPYCHEEQFATPYSRRKRTTFLCKHRPMVSKRKTVGVIIEFVDITKQKKEVNALTRAKDKAEKERKTAALYLDRIIADLPFNVYWVDKNSANLGCNENTRKSFGLESREAVRGLTYKQLSKISNIPKEHTDIWRKHDLQVMKTGKPIFNTTNNLVKPNGELVYQTTDRTPLFDENNKVIGVIGISADITSRVRTQKELEEAKERAELANKAKTEFVATVSHELRTPLNGIMGMADILSNEPLNKKQKAYINDILHSSKALLTLINELLDLSKIESNMLILEKSEFSMMDLITKVASQVNPLIKEKRLSLDIEYLNKLPNAIIADYQKIYQIITNVIGNAVKFTDKGSVKISTKSTEISDSRVNFEISITDTGMGIPSTKITSIFDRFTQIEPSYNKKHQGTGLGLNIVKRLLEFIDGKIEVKSSLGKGTTFKITLPCDVPTDRARLNAWQKNNAKVRVLILADDNSQGEQILNRIKTPHVELLTGDNIFEILENRANQDQYCQVIISTNPKILKNHSLKKIQYILQQHYRPLVVHCFSGKKTPKVKSDIVDEVISLDGSAKDFSDELSRMWQHYKDKKQKSSEKLIDMKSKILLVEDSIINQRVAGLMLKNLGCVVDIADNGFDAIEKFKNENYDLILMDIGLPDMDGYVTSKKIRRVDSRGKHIPIIALTAFASPEDKKKCLKVSINSVITKPITMDMLKSALTNWLSYN